MEFLLNLLTEDKPSISIRKNLDEIFKIIPELSLCENFNQNNSWHIYDVLEHILHVVDGVPNNIILRLAALFHDIGKPYVYKEDEKGIGHFYGHWEKSNEIFLKFAEKYELDNTIKKKVSNLILYHDINIDKLNEIDLEQILSAFDKEEIIMLFQLKRSDLLAQNKEFHYIIDKYKSQEEKLLSKKR